MTGMDLARKKGGKMSSSTAGYAYVGGACIRNINFRKISSVAIVEDSGGYSGVLVAAHEIGHLLGAVHDGDSAPRYLRGPGAKSCPWSKGYIMSDLRRTVRGQLWSDCSIKQIQYFLKTKTASCLLNQPRHQDYPLPGPGFLPGRQLSLDAQCYADKGTRACYHDQRVCTQLFCYNKNYRGCYAYHPAVEGSSCGTGKLCTGGRCVHESKVKNKEQKSLREAQRKPVIEIATTKLVTTTVTTMQTPSKQKLKILNNVYTTNKTTNKPIKSTNSKKFEFTTTTKAPIKMRKETSKPPRNPKQQKISEDSPSTDSCTDSFSVLGSLTCVQLFQRYAFHYCVRSRVIKKKCCQTYRRVCNAPR